MAAVFLDVVRSKATSCGVFAATLRTLEPRLRSVDTLVSSQLGWGGIMLLISAHEK